MSAAGPHILFVITDLNVGGVPLHLHRLAVEMRRRGFQTTVVSLALPGPMAGRLLDDGVGVHSCGGVGGWDFRVIGKLAEMMRLERPNLVHALLFHANLASRRAAKKAGIPPDRILCEIQTVEVERRWHLWVDRFTHRGCRLTIGNSPSVIDHLATRAHIPRDRLHLVRGGIDPKRLADAPAVDRATLPVQSDARIVLWTGRLDPIKGLDVLLRAFARVDAAHNAHLLLAGDGPIRRQIERDIATLGLTDRVHLLGTRSDVPSLLKAADVFTLPSRTEGLPNALLEAMAAGLPIVTTNAPGCRDLIDDSRTGLVVPYGNTAALTAALTELLTNRDRATQLGRRAMEEVTSGWHIAKTFDAYETLYRDVLRT